MNNDTHNITLTEVQVALLRKLLSPSVEPTDDGGYEGDEDAIGIIRQLDISERVCQTGLWLSRYTIEERYGGPEEGGWWYDGWYLDWSECLTVEDLVTQWNELVHDLNDEAMPGHELVSVNDCRGGDTACQPAARGRQPRRAHPEHPGVLPVRGRCPCRSLHARGPGGRAQSWCSHLHQPSPLLLTGGDA